MNVSVSSRRRKENTQCARDRTLRNDSQYRAGSRRLRPAMWTDDLPGGNPLLEIVCYFSNATAASQEYFRRNENFRQAWRSQIRMLTQFVNF